MTHFISHPLSLFQPEIIRVRRPYYLPGRRGTNRFVSIFLPSIFLPLFIERPTAEFRLMGWSAVTRPVCEEKRHRRGPTRLRSIGLKPIFNAGESALSRKSFFCGA